MKTTCQLEARILIPGQAHGAAMVLTDSLSFWGGFDPRNGAIIDVHHPQYQQRVGGRILCIGESRGSAGTPGGIAETLRNGSGPLAFILAQADVNIGVGVLVANKLYDLTVPVLQLTLADLGKIAAGDCLSIDRHGLITIERLSD